MIGLGNIILNNYIFFFFQAYILLTLCVYDNRSEENGDILGNLLVPNILNVVFFLEFIALVLEL